MTSLATSLRSSREHQAGGANGVVTKDVADFADLVDGRGALHNPRASRA